MSPRYERMPDTSGHCAYPVWKERREDDHCPTVSGETHWLRTEKLKLTALVLLAIAKLDSDTQLASRCRARAGIEVPSEFVASIVNGELKLLDKANKIVLIPPVDCTEDAR